MIKSENLNLRTVRSWDIKLSNDLPKNHGEKMK